MLPDDERPSSPMTSSPHMASNPTEFAPQPGSFEQKSVETHSGKKRHKCDVCGSYWGRPSSLKIHMVSHTGVKGMNTRHLLGLQPS
jgi:predicted HD phosphohydrolase